MFLLKGGTMKRSEDLCCDKIISQEELERTIISLEKSTNSSISGTSASLGDLLQSDAHRIGKLIDSIEGRSLEDDSRFEYLRKLLKQINEARSRLAYYIDELNNLFLFK